MNSVNPTNRTQPSKVCEPIPERNILERGWERLRDGREAQYCTEDRIKQLPPLIPLEGYCQTGGLPGWNGNIRNFPKREDQWWEDTIKKEIFGEKQPLFNDARRITEWFKYNCSRYGDPAESFLRDPQILVLSILCRKIY